MLALGAFAVNLDMRAVVPLLPNLAADLGVNISTAGLVATAYMLPYGLFQLVYGPLADRWGRLPIARGTLLVFVLGTTACGLATSFEMLVGIRILTGAVAAAAFPMGLAFIGDAFEYEDRPSALSVLLTTSAISQLLSLALGGILADFVSWRAIFFLDGALAFLILLGLFWIRGTERPASTGGTLAAYRAVFGAGRRLIVMFLAFLEGMLLMGGMTFLGAYLRDRWELSYVVIGLCLALYGAALVISGKLLPWAARRMSEPSRFVLGGILSVAGYVGLALVPSWQAAAALMIPLGFGWTAAHSVLQARSTEILPRARGTAIAVFACGLFMGGAAGTALIGGLIGAVGYQVTLGALGVSVIGFTVLGWWGLKTTAPGAAPA
jgi:YNFM family putative membrane transporter